MDDRKLAATQAGKSKKAAGQEESGTVRSGEAVKPGRGSTKKPEKKIELKADAFLPLRDVVFISLREAILNGSLQPGERLMEIHLAKMLGVSRTPVREAIRMLEQEGLVITVPRKGAVVAEITLKDLEDVLEVREALEELAVRKACHTMKPEELKTLEEAAAAFEECVKKGECDVLVSAQADVTFHEIISNSTGNKRLIAILNNLRSQMYRYRVENLKNKNSYPDLVEQHRKICRALREGDEEAAAAAIRKHIQNQRTAIMEYLHME